MIIKYTTSFLILFTLFSPLMAESIYQEYMSSYDKGNHKESDYFQKWINLPANKNLLINATPDNELIEYLIETESNSSSFIGVIKNKEFQIQSYLKSDNEKFITYRAEVIECYKSICPKVLTYKVSMEIDDAFYPDGSKEKLVFLEEIDKEFYSDPFASFRASENIKKIFRGKFKKQNTSERKPEKNKAPVSIITEEKELQKKSHKIQKPSK